MPSEMRADTDEATALVRSLLERGPAICRDPGDDDLVALASAALVDALATGDRDLLALEEIGVAVITPRGLVERLADAR